MRITKWGEYGILCSLSLANRYGGEAIGAAELADDHNIPLQYTQQILQRLRRGGIVSSVRGPGGGYQLARPAESVTLKEILEVTEGGTFAVICDQNTIHADCHSSDRPCGLRNVWTGLRGVIDEYLSSHTLASLCEYHQCQVRAEEEKDGENSLSILGG